VSANITTASRFCTGCSGGEHLHHGYWNADESIARAQIQLMERLAEHAGISTSISKDIHRCRNSSQVVKCARTPGGLLGAFLEPLPYLNSPPIGGSL
jgi:hypothetical protein